MVARKSSRIKKSPVVYQAPEQTPRTSRNVTPKPIQPRRMSNRDIELQMECIEDELSPAQLKAIKEAQKEHEKANDLIKEVRAGNILVPSSQPNTFTIVPPKPPPAPPQPPAPLVQVSASKSVSTQQDAVSQRGLPPPRPAQFLSKHVQEMNKTPGSRSSPDVILISDTPAVSATSKVLPSTMPASQMTGNQLQMQQVTGILASQGPGATPQQVYKFVTVPSNVPANMVQNQWALRPLLTVPPRQQTQMAFLSPTQDVSQIASQGSAVTAQKSQIPAPRSTVAPKIGSNQNQAVKRPSPTELATSQPPAKKRISKTTEFADQTGNWVPLDEYYYGTHEGDVSYTEEKGEYRFKCWYCSKMLYNNVRAMQHIQGHIDASKQQNIDLSDLTQCKHCYKQFDTPFEMQTHVEKVHLSNKVLMCRICEKDFSTPRELTVHMKGNHHACEMPYVCHLCNFRSSMYSDVVDHFKKKHDSSHYMLCLYCLRTFEVKFVSQGWGQTQTYYGHLLKHQTKSATKKCVVCRLTFFNAIDVKNHRKNCHTGNYKDVRALTIGGKADSGLKQKKGSNLKSLNAPSVSRIQDYGEIIFPAEASNTKCVECKMLMSSTDHYKKYVHCSMCRFATSCSVAYANHMMGFHSGQMSSLNLNIPWERPMKEFMYCACGFNSKYGNKIANHLVYCAKRTCYSTRRSETDTTPGKTGDEKKEGSILGMLGLVQKSAVATTEETSEIRTKPKQKTESGIKESDKLKETEIKFDRKDLDETKQEVNTDRKDLDETKQEIKTDRKVLDETKQEIEPVILDEIDTTNNENKIMTVSETTKYSDKENQESAESKVSFDEKSNKFSDESDKVVEESEKEEPEKEADIVETDKGDDKSTDEKEQMDTEVVNKPEDLHPNLDTQTEQDRNTPELTKDEKEVMDTETVNDPGSAVDNEPEIKQTEEKLDDNILEKDDEEDMDSKETDTKENLDDTEELEQLDKTEDKEMVNEMDTLPEAVESHKSDLSKEDGRNGNDMKQSEPIEGDTENKPDEEDEIEDSVEEKNTLELTTENTDESTEPTDKAQEKIGDVLMEEETEESKEEEFGESPAEKDEIKTKEEEELEEDKEEEEQEKLQETEKSAQKESGDHGESRSSVEKTSSDDHRSQEGHSSGDNRDSSERHSREKNDSRDRHHSGSGERSRHDDQSRRDDRHRQENRSYGSNRSDSYHSNRSYDQNRDRDRSYDRDRDRDYNRNRDYRHGDSRSGHGYQDNRGQGYGGGGQGYRAPQGQYGGYQGNRGGHHQDRNYNRNYQNRGGYNQNYRGGYRGGYY